MRSFVGLWRAHFAHCAVAFITLVTVLGVALVVMLAGLDEVPAWWRTHERINPADAAVVQRAELIENAITTQLTAVRDPSDPSWRVKVSDEQANAWLSVRLRDTLVTHMGERAWDERIERVLVRFEEDGVRIGTRVRHNSGSAIVSARVRLSLDDAGDLWAEIGAVRVGASPVPAWAIALLGGGDVRVGRVRIGPGELRLGDGRVARLLALRTRDGWIDLAVETVPEQ